MEKIYTSVVIPAAGQGRRMKASINKQYLTLRGKPILSYTLDVFEKCALVDEIVLVVNKDEVKLCHRQVLTPYGYKKVRLVAGGDTRQKSVYAGLKQVNPRAEIVLIHDGARPLIQEETIVKSICETLEHRATVVAVPAKNTIKVVDEGGMVHHTPDRATLYEIQTPQSFDYTLILEAYERALQDDFEGTDDASLAERLGIPVKIVLGHYNNIKITTPEDLIIAESMIDFFINQ
ncbi:MAG: 2-C-methyl-D-erythritol 4-phosphate cytidylyltransferase [Eubacterium sp.]|nr:2-C-methyl-D-erythritol 4-phosphate cytidylyltransferase [Eubacterium sp.]